MSANKPQEIAAVIAFARMGISILTDRALVWVAYVGVVCVFARAAIEPSWGTAGVAALYCAMVFLPIYFSERKQRQTQGSEQ